jgi:phosphatidylglycerophosphatase A
LSTPPSLGFWHPASLIGTWFGVGMLPKAPGLWAALAALPVAFSLQHAAGPLGVAIGCAILFVSGLWATEMLLKNANEEDGTEDTIVIDNVTGQTLTLVAVPADPVFYAIAYIGFTLMIVMKPWPMTAVRPAFKGAVGIMLDDVFGAIVIAALLFFSIQGVPA